MLLTATVPLISPKDCRKSLIEVAHMVTEQNICAGGSLGDACLVNTSNSMKMCTKIACMSLN